MVKAARKLHPQAELLVHPECRPEVVDRVRTWIEAAPVEAVVSAQRVEEVVASSNSDKYHRLTCDYTDNILEENKVYYKTPADAERDGKYACSVCRP